MGATDSVMGAPEGLLSVFFITGFLLGTCLNEETCVGDACFNEGVLQLKIDRARTDTGSGLRYKERSKDLVPMVDVIGVCLPGVNPKALADSFSSCKNEKMEEVCTVAKRGWLENKEGKSVVNENGLLATFGEIKGGEDAVRECLQIPEVYEYEYYEYDYADYYEEYDYLEESGRRIRRAAATGREKGSKEAKREARKEQRRERKEKRKTKNGGKREMGKSGSGRRRSKKECKKGNNCKKDKRQKKKKERKTEKKAKKAAEKKAKKAAEKKAKKAAEKKEQRAAKIAARQEEKEASKSDKDDQKKALTKLGLQKMPSKSSLNKLTCVQNKIKELLVSCAKDILSKTN